MKGKCGTEVVFRPWTKAKAREASWAVVTQLIQVLAPCVEASSTWVRVAADSKSAAEMPLDWVKVPNADFGLIPVEAVDLLVVIVPVGPVDLAVLAGLVDPFEETGQDRFEPQTAA